MPGLEDLYREIVLDHYKNPRHRGELPPPAAQSKGYNPLCGDEVIVSVLVSDGKVVDIATTGQGCSISQSSASLMSEAVIGHDLGEVAELTAAFKAQLGIHDDEDGEGDGEADHSAVKLGELEALKGVMKFPSRIKCATLAWNTLDEALAEAAGSS